MTEATAAAIWIITTLKMAIAAMATAAIVIAAIATKVIRPINI